MDIQGLQSIYNKAEIQKHFFQGIFFGFYFSKKLNFRHIIISGYTSQCQQVVLLFLFLQLFRNLRYLQTIFMQENEPDFEDQNENLYYYGRKASNRPFNIKKNDTKIYPIYSKMGHWTQDQKLQYALFLLCFREQLEMKQNRRCLRIFKYMSKFMKSRNPNQCRSHHQKMNTQFGSVANIIDYYSEHYPNLGQKYELKKSQLQSFLQIFTNKLNDQQLEEKKQDNCFTKEQFFSIFEVFQNKHIEHSNKQVDDKEMDLPPTGIEYFSVQKVQPTPSRIVQKIQAKARQDMTPMYQNPYIKHMLVNANDNDKKSLEIGLKLSSQVPRFPNTEEHMRKQNEWLQCHRYFVEWITRLNGLVNCPTKSQR